MADSKAQSDEPTRKPTAARGSSGRWLLAVVAILLVGMVLQLDLLVYAMYVLLGVMIVSRRLARTWIDGISATRDLSRPTANIGEKAAIVVTVRNESRIPIVWSILEDSLPRDALAQRPPRIKVEGRRQCIASLSGGGQTSILYQVTFLMRGYYQVGPLLAETGDLFGLHRRYKVLTEPGFVLVYPKVIPVDGYDISSRRPIGEVRMVHRLFEDPTRISGVRPYIAGDPLNRIHWKASARVGALHSRVFEPSTVAGASLLLDFHIDSYLERGEPHRSELAITVAASLANAVNLLNQQIGFFTNGRDAADRIREEGWKHEFRTRTDARQNAQMAAENTRLRPVAVPTSRGAEQMPRILETLARLEFTNGLSFSELLLECSSRLPRDASVIVVLPDVSGETAIALGSLRRRGFAVTVVLVMYSDEHDYADCVGRLLAERVEVRHVEDEDMLADLCSSRVATNRLTL